MPSVKEILTLYQLGQCGCIYFPNLDNRGRSNNCLDLKRLLDGVIHEFKTKLNRPDSAATAETLIYGCIIFGSSVRSPRLIRKYRKRWFRRSYDTYQCMEKIESDDVDLLLLLNEPIGCSSKIEPDKRIMDDGYIL